MGFDTGASRDEVGESLKTKLARWRFNYFPAYRRTGGRIRYIAADWSEVRVRLRLTRRTRNYVGTIFGGSMFGAVDPVYMVMLIQHPHPASGAMTGPPQPGHALVVGGTGMLAGAARELARQGRIVTVVARRGGSLLRRALAGRQEADGAFELVI